jgi:signal transduction histidine kinase
VTASRSLEARLLIVSFLWIVLALGAAAIVLSGLYRDHVQREHADRAEGYLDELAAAIDVAPDGTLAMQRDLSDPLFRRPYAGLYWEVTVDGRSQFRSRSLWNDSLGLGGVDGMPFATSAVAGPEGQHLTAWTRTVRYPQFALPVTMHVAADSARIDSMTTSFTRTLTVSLATLALGLIGVVVAQVRFGLAPLRRLGRAMTQLREAQVDQVEGDYPSEVRPLVEDLNAVLNENRELLTRARAQAGNLAHALKTPLAVIRNSLSPSASPEVAAVAPEVERMHLAIERHLVRARAGATQVQGRHVAVKPALEEVVRAVQRMHGGAVAIESSCDAGTRFRGDAADLQEILGNLLDNAVKWARSRVLVAVTVAPGRIHIEIQDDGAGIPPQLRPEAIQRGVRLDTSRPGSGLGLQIVDELCRVYGGQMELGDSSLGGLLVAITLPGR